MGQSVLRDRRNPFRSETSAETQTHARVCLAADRKEWVNIPQPGKRNRSFGTKCGNATELGDVDGGPGED
ncbi:hypothetical protein JTE90_020211 [Oedothorax gibbosus]|uniref:Uncharacterized protein n=1 Tax=Oedothorax gibbosus TaxID=931172 RepID=A0AAV6TFB8_9ARAC|nr:hypothetical protein JTE90_020211 [Oedothorax gibbosus]